MAVAHQRESDRSVVDGEVALLDDAAVNRSVTVCSMRIVRASWLCSSKGEGLVGGEAAGVVGNLQRGAGGDDLGERDADVDVAADEERVD